ncbi:MAG: helix-turn-helix transcriptional regulator [Clostridium sp.]
MEKLLNHLDICILLYHGNTIGAIELFKDKINSLDKQLSIFDYKLYISSLNINIYNYILREESISLHQCCYENAKLIDECTSYSRLINTGEIIISSYGNCSDYLIEKYENPHIKKALTYIHNHIHEPLTLANVCENININRCYLCDIFKKNVGTNFSEYVTKQRINLSKKLLIHSDLPLDIISNRCAFCNISYFCTTFKKFTGNTPLSYRNKLSG